MKYQRSLIPDSSESLANLMLFLSVLTLLSACLLLAEAYLLKAFWLMLWSPSGAPMIGLEALRLSALNFFSEKAGLKGLRLSAFYSLPWSEALEPWVAFAACCIVCPPTFWSM